MQYKDLMADPDLKSMYENVSDWMTWRSKIRVENLPRNVEVELTHALAIHGDNLLDMLMDKICERVTELHTPRPGARRDYVRVGFELHGGSHGPIEAGTLHELLHMAINNGDIRALSRLAAEVTNIHLADYAE